MQAVSCRRSLTLTLGCILTTGPLLLFGLSAGGVSAQDSEAEDTYLLVAGRRLPYLYAISLDAALDPANDGTSNAVLSRSKVALDRLDGRPLGDPANLIVDEDGRSVYVVNHHGSIDNAEFRQHGGRGQISVLDVDQVIDPANDRTANALLRHMDSGGFGSLGVGLLPQPPRDQ